MFAKWQIDEYSNINNISYTSFYLTRNYKRSFSITKFDHATRKSISEDRLVMNITSYFIHKLVKSRGKSN